MIDSILENLAQVMQFIELPYLIIVILAGWLFTKNEVLAPLGKSKIRTFLLSVNKFYRVLVLSTLAGVVYNLIKPDTSCLNLLISYLAANVIYEAGAYKITTALEGMVQKKKA